MPIDGEYRLSTRQFAAELTRSASVSHETHTLPPTDELWERVLDIIEKEAGVDRTRLTPPARFVDDLGMD